MPSPPSFYWPVRGSQDHEHATGNCTTPEPGPGRVGRPDGPS